MAKTPRGFFDPTAVSRPAWFDVTEFARGWFDSELLGRDTTATPSAGTLTLTGYAPTRVVGIVRTPGTGALAFTGYAPTLQIVSHVEWGWLAGGIGGPPFTVGADGRVSFKPRKQFKRPRKTARAGLVVHAVRVNAPATVRVAQPQRVESVAVVLPDPRLAQRVREDDDVLLGVL